MAGSGLQAHSEFAEYLIDAATIDGKMHFCGP